jgi:hypothetical protein
MTVKKVFRVPEKEATRV